MGKCSKCQEKPDGLRARVRGHLHRARRLSACGRAEKVELVVLWEELLVAGRLEWKKNTLSDLPPTQRA